MIGLAKMLRPVSKIFPLGNNLPIRPNTIEFKILHRAGFQIDQEGAKMGLYYSSSPTLLISTFGMLVRGSYKHLVCDIRFLRQLILGPTDHYSCPSFEQVVES